MKWKKFGLFLAAGMLISSLAGISSAAGTTGTGGVIAGGTWTGTPDPNAGGGKAYVWNAGTGSLGDGRWAIDLCNPNSRESVVYYDRTIDPGNVTLTLDGMTFSPFLNGDDSYYPRPGGGSFGIQIMNKAATRFIWTPGGEQVTDENRDQVGYLLVVNRLGTVEEPSKNQLQVELHSVLDQRVGEPVTVTFPTDFVQTETERTQSFDFRFYGGQVYINNVLVAFGEEALTYIGQANAQMEGTGYISTLFNIEGGNPPLSQFVVYDPRYYTDEDIALGETIREKIDSLPDTVTRENVDEVEAVVTAYDNLSVLRLTLIDKARQRQMAQIKRLVELCRSDMAAEAFHAQVALLKDVDALTLADRETVETLEYLYHGLTKAQREAMDPALKQRLYAAVKRMDVLTGENFLDRLENPDRYTTTAPAANGTVTTAAVADPNVTGGQGSTTGGQGAATDGQGSTAPAATTASTGPASSADPSSPGTGERTEGLYGLVALLGVCSLAVLVIFRRRANV